MCAATDPFQRFVSGGAGGTIEQEVEPFFEREA